jgi:hypothetical protein
MSRTHKMLANSIVILLAVCLSTAQTALKKPGDILTYDLLDHTQISGGHLPPQAYKPQPEQVGSIKIVVTSLEPDGTALVHVAIDRPYPEKDIASRLGGGPLAAARNGVILASSRKEWEEQNRYKQFDARFTRDGALIFVVDNSEQGDSAAQGQGKAMTQEELAHMRDAMVVEVHSPAYQAKLAENDVAGKVAIPNMIALSCAKRTSFAAGDAWHVVSKSDGATYDVTITSKQPYHGHDTIVLSAKTHFDYPSGSNNTEATVYYDPQAHLVVGVHGVATGYIQVTGMTSTTTSDLNLKE